MINPKKGFTLIELMVVITIISLLASILISSLDIARAKARDVRRAEDMHQIANALELYISTYGTLPQPPAYGESNSSPGWWDGSWDLSTKDVNGDGNKFLDFLVTSNLMKTVPVDPLNDPVNFNGSPEAAGHFYIYAVMQTDNFGGYQGGSCVYSPGSTQSVWFLAVSDMETKGRGAYGSKCDCLFKNLPNFYGAYHDYVMCGTF